MFFCFFFLGLRFNGPVNNISLGLRFNGPVNNISLGLKLMVL